MSSRPGPHRDSARDHAPDSPEQANPPREKSRKDAEDSAGDFVGTAGTGGENKAQDQSFER